MKRFSFSDLNSTNSGHLVEKVELIRSRLRLANQLGRSEIDALLEEFSQLRADLLMLDHRAPAAQGVSANLLDQSESDDAAKPKAARPAHTDLGFEGVLGESPGLLEALEIVRRAAPTDLPFLIDGESGTGKELFAKVIHTNSERADQPFVSVNCGAIPDNLIESELFGHKKGAFTGASSDRQGRFEAAHGGTIFLDEVGELPLEGQVKLLRVLQASEIQRVGSDQPIKVDCRVVAATNRNLARMAKEGTFREDLFYRLSVIHASLPPLRERRDEIPVLCEFFATQAAQELRRERLRFSNALNEFLLAYQYPGNIRELRNLIFRLSCLADTEADLHHLPTTTRDNALQAKLSGAPQLPGAAHLPGTMQSSDGQSLDPSLGERVLEEHAVAEDSWSAPIVNLADAKRQASDAAERRVLEAGLRQTAGRVVDLAVLLDMNRSHLQTLLKKHGLRSKSFRPGNRG